MAKLSLTDVTATQNQTSLAATINSNHTKLETALEKTLSRDGTSPNAMESDLDMNSMRILNLPYAESSTEPATLGQLEAITGVNFTALYEAVADAEAARDDLLAQKGQPNGIAPLNSSGVIPLSYLGQAAVTDGDKGDIVVSSSGATWSTEKASTAEALAGTDSAKVMTAARVKERVTADIAAMRSRLPVIDVTPSFDPASPVDITSTIVSYLDNYGACVLPPGEWLTTSTIELKSRSLTGLNTASTTLRGNISSEWLPVIRAGRNCRIAEMTLRYIDAQVTAANTAAGSRVLIDTVGAASGDYPMQRPSSIERVVFGRCGTGFSDRGEALFSVSLRDLEFYDFARAGIDLWGSFNTGCVWSNIYVGASQFTPVIGFSSVGFRSEDSIDQLNIEHSLFSDTALRLERQNNLHIGTLHIEGAGLSTTQKGLVTISNSIVTIDSANFFFTRLPQAASSLFSLGYTGYYDGVVDNTVGFRLGYLKIGGLTAYGVGQPDTTIYPGQAANLTSSFNFFYRHADTDRFLVDIDRYDYRTYNTDATTVSRYQTMASDPNSSIHFVKKSAIRRSYPTASLPSGGLTMTGQTAFDETTGALKVYNNSGAWVPMPSYLSGSATFDPTSLADGAGTTTTVTVTGAALGDVALASFSLTTSGILITAWVSAADTVSVRFQNESGGTLDIASGTLKAVVFKT